MTAPVKVGLLGIGTVGSGTYRVLERNSAEIARRAGRRIEIGWVCARDLERARGIVGPGIPVVGDAVRAVGLGNIVLETDSPYLAPEPYRGKRNEPAFIAATATRLAELFQTEIADIISRTGANAAALFAP